MTLQQQNNEGCVWNIIFIHLVMIKVKDSWSNQFQVDLLFVCVNLVIQGAEKKPNQTATLIQTTSNHRLTNNRLKQLLQQWKKSEKYLFHTQQVKFSYFFYCTLYLRVHIFLTNHWKFSRLLTICTYVTVQRKGGTVLMQCSNLFHICLHSTSSSTSSTRCCTDHYICIPPPPLSKAVLPQ